MLQETASSMRFSTPGSPINAPRSSADMHVSRHTVLCALVLFCFAACLVAVTGCASQPRATDEGTAGFPSTPSSQGTDAPEQSPSSPSGASAFAANLPDADAADAVSVQPLIIEETGWWAKDGYVHYGITVRNPNNVAAANAVVQVTLLDAQGTAQGTWERTIGLVEAEQTVGFAGEAGDGLVPDRVEFAMDDNSVTWKDGSSTSPFAIGTFSEEDKLYFRYEITGQITNATDAYESTANLSVLLRDDEGRIAAGYIGSAYRIKAQRTKDFLVTLHSAPDHAKVEVYAQPA